MNKITETLEDVTPYNSTSFRIQRWFSNRDFRAFCENSSMDEKTIAKRLGVSTDVVQNLCRGQCSLTLKKAFGHADRLKMNVADLWDVRDLTGWDVGGFKTIEQDVAWGPRVRKAIEDRDTVVARRNMDRVKKLQAAMQESGIFFPVVKFLEE